MTLLPPVGGESSVLTIPWGGNEPPPSHHPRPSLPFGGVGWGAVVKVATCGAVVVVGTSPIRTCWEKETERLVWEREGMEVERIY